MLHVFVEARALSFIASVQHEECDDEANSDQQPHMCSIVETGRQGSSCLIFSLLLSSTRIFEKS